MLKKRSESEIEDYSKDERNYPDASCELDCAARAVKFTFGNYYDTAVTDPADTSGVFYPTKVYKLEKTNDKNLDKSKNENYQYLFTATSPDDVYYDYNIANRRRYEYVYEFVFGENDDFDTTQGYDTVEWQIDYDSVHDEPRPYSTSSQQASMQWKNRQLETDWLGWSLTELHEVEGSNGKKYEAYPYEVWRFKYNVQPGQYTQNLSKTKQETLGKYPKFSNGPKNSIAGTLQCLLGDIIMPDDLNGNCNKMAKELYQTEDIRKYERNYTETIPDLFPNSYYSTNNEVDKADAWKKICYSGNPKLLKDQKGNKFLVQITDCNIEIQDTWNRMPSTISFSWEEIGPTEDITILSPLIQSREVTLTENGSTNLQAPPPMSQVGVTVDVPEYQGEHTQNGDGPQ